MALINYFGKKDLSISKGSLVLDMAVLLTIVLMLFVLSAVASDMWGVYEVGDSIEIDLSPMALPYYAVRTIMRMFIALLFSLLFAFGVGSWAAKSQAAEKIIIPVIDVLQSIPVIGFLEVSFIWFIYAFKGRFLGPEMASIFAVFVSQVWNLILSYYQSLKVMPKDLDEVMKIYQLTPWQRFFKLEIPFAAPGLIWNSMLSLSAGWFFVVAGEAITIANHDVSLPGIGSYIAKATRLGDQTAIYYAIVCLFLVIMLYDQLIFRPLNFWLNSKNSTEEHIRPNWVWLVVSRSLLVRWLYGLSKRMGRLFFRKRRVKKREARIPSALGGMVVYALLGGLLLWLIHYCYHMPMVPWSEVKTALVLGGYTALRVFVLVFLCCLVWFPVGLYLGLNTQVADILQPIIQFLAAFPPNMLYPLVGSVVILKGYNPNIWLSPLIVLGTQWYILFNIIAGVRSLPQDLLLMAKSLRLSRWAYYKKVIIPGVLPSLLTGVITAAGGAWNTSIVAEAVEWEGKFIYAKGLGAYIMKASRGAEGDLVFIGVSVMCLYVFVINRILWVPMYKWVEKKYGGQK